MKPTPKDVIVYRCTEEIRALVVAMYGANPVDANVGVVLEHICTALDAIREHMCATDRGLRAAGGEL